LRAIAPLFVFEVNRMGVTECSMCRRPAAWLIDTEVFCEAHKELIIETAGVDRFTIRRLTVAEPAFRSGGRVSGRPAPKKEGRNVDGENLRTSR
jgi:hypothetical protein